jgi:hypothetical protein
MSTVVLRNTLTVLAAILFLSACTTAPELSAVKGTVEEAKTQPPPPPAEPVAGMTALYEMYKPARAWAADLLPLSLAPTEIPGVKNADGKAGMWTAVFVSAGRMQARTYCYAVADGPQAPKGVTARAVQAWGGPTRENKPFQINEVMVNSDKAWKTASDKAEPWLKKHPNKAMTLSLVSSSRFASPIWFIMWGNTKDGYAAFVNATTGEMLSGK